MSYDLIIVTQSKRELIAITQQCIDSARKDNADLKVIIVETGEPYKYDVDKIIKYEGSFCYNRALNMGLAEAKGDVHILANNDIIFYEGWSKIGELMQVNGFHSASAYAGHLTMLQQGNYVYESYNVGYTFTGWCLFADRYCIEKIGKLDETVSFWFSDDLYACQLKAAGIKHGMFTCVRVDHLCSKTLTKQPSRIQRHYQMGELQKYYNRKKYYAQRERINQVHT